MHHLIPKTAFAALTAVLCSVSAVSAASTPAATLIPHADETNRAESLDPARLPADTGWVFRVDLDALRRSHLGRFVLDPKQNPDIVEHREEMIEEFGVDFIEHTRTFTAHSTIDDSESATIVLVTNDAADKFAAMLPELAEGMDYEYALVGGVKMHRVYDKDTDELFFIDIEPGPRSDERVILAGKSSERILKTRAVMRGAAPSLNEIDDAPMRVSPHDDALVYLQTVSPEHLSRIGVDSNIIKHTQLAQAQLYETDDRVHAELTVVTEDAAQAKAVCDVIQGLVGLAVLVGNDSSEMKQLAELASGFEYDATGNRLRVSYNCDIEVVKGLLKDSD